MDHGEAGRAGGVGADGARERTADRQHLRLVPRTVSRLIRESEPLGGDRVSMPRRAAGPRHATCSTAAPDGSWSTRECG